MLFVQQSVEDDREEGHVADGWLLEPTILIARLRKMYVVGDVEMGGDAVVVDLVYTHKMKTMFEDGMFKEEDYVYVQCLRTMRIPIWIQMIQEKTIAGLKITAG
jgi:hypothetical protein